MASLFSKVSSAVAACARRVSRATRRLFRARRLCQGGSLEGQHVAAAQGQGGSLEGQHVAAAQGQGGSLEGQHVAAAQGQGGSYGTGVGEGGEGLWRRAILMGERCEPLDFAGAIHYDNLGRRIVQPRSRAKEAALRCRSSSDAVDEAVTASKKARYVALVQN